MPVRLSGTPSSRYGASLRMAFTVSKPQEAMCPISSDAPIVRESPAKPREFWCFCPNETMDLTTLQVLLIVFLATVIRSAFGFGEALIAVPLLVLIIPVGIAAPVAVLLSITIAAIVVVQDWRKIHVRSTGWLLLPTFLGLFLSALRFIDVAATSTLHYQNRAGDPDYCILRLLNSGPEAARTAQRQPCVAYWAPAGFLAGVLGGAYGMNGPPLVVYGAMRRWSPQHIRATLQGYFLPASIVAMAGYWFYRRLVGSGCNALLPDIPARRAPRDISRPLYQPPPARRFFSRLCLPRPDVRWRAPVDTGNPIGSVVRLVECFGANGSDSCGSSHRHS